ncbi:hypothetical protein J2T12_002436 [Paenibacillus anaericanus]|nr:hypothetical protein [Paenibacillus anaericanus]
MKDVSVNSPGNQESEEGGSRVAPAKKQRYL